MAVSVLAVLDELGIEYRVSGDEATALCPSPKHVDRHPSWSVNLDSGKHLCFSCGYGGPLIRLVRDVRHSGEDEARLWMRTRYSGTAHEEERAQPALPRINEASLALFDPAPSRELEKRMISSDAAAELGILWDAKERAWILPFRDESGKLHGWQSKQTRGKKLVTNHPRGIRKSGFLFGLHAAGSAQCVLVESPLDVGRIRTAGPRGGVASYGVRVSRLQLGLITARFGELVVALDNDEPGWDESDKIRKTFHRIPVRFFDYGDSPAKDPGEMEDEEIRWGIDNSVSAMIARF